MGFTVFAAALAAGIVQGSFVEWAFHRYWLHRPWQPKDCFTTHTLIHHQLCKFEDTFHVEHEEQHEALHFAWWGGPTLILINMAPWALIGLGLSAVGIQLPWIAWTLGIGAAMTVYYIGYEGFHYLMHKPSIGWIERSKVFLYLKKHHQIHHVHMDRNLNVLLPLADLVLGTYVPDAPSPAVTPAAAKRLARRHSTYGQKLREAGVETETREREDAETVLH